MSKMMEYADTVDKEQCISVDYQKECCRLQQRIGELVDENESYRKALLKLCLKT